MTNWTMTLEGVVFLLALVAAFRPLDRHLVRTFWVLRTMLGS